MDDFDLESLAVKEIIEEIERKKRDELESRRLPQRQVRPNKRFLGRTIVSVLQHNRRQYAQEQRNSSRKLRELDRRRRRSRSKSRSKERRRIRVRSPIRSPERNYPMEADPFPHEMQLDLPTMLFLNNMNQLLSNVPKQQKLKKKKERSEIRTIDLTKKKRRDKLKKKKTNKSRRKAIKSKKRRRRKDSSDSSSSSSSSSSKSSSIRTLTDSESSSGDCSQSSTLLIDLT